MLLFSNSLTHSSTLTYLSLSQSLTQVPTCLCFKLYTFVINITQIKAPIVNKQNALLCFSNRFITNKVSLTVQLHFAVLNFDVEFVLRKSLVLVVL